MIGEKMQKRLIVKKCQIISPCKTKNTNQNLRTHLNFQVHCRRDQMALGSHDPRVAHFGPLWKCCFQVPWHPTPRICRNRSRLSTAWPATWMDVCALESLHPLPWSEHAAKLQGPAVWCGLRMHARCLHLDEHLASGQWLALGCAQSGRASSEFPKATPSLLFTVDNIIMK